MKTKTVFIAVMCCIIAFAGQVTLAEQPPAGPGQREQVDETRQIRREISLLNLLNGLYLSSDQLDKLIPLAESAGQLRGGYVNRLGDESDSYLGQLTALRDALYTATGPAAELKQEIGRRHRKLDVGPRRDNAEGLGRLEDQARAILSDGQIAIIERFKPCLLPPKNLADPVAVGQASTTEREEVVLDVIRRMPASLYAKRRVAIAGAIVQMGQREKGNVPEDIEKGMIDTYLKKLDKLRRLSSVDFELKKKEIAESFRLFDDDATYYKGRIRQLGPISRHLLNEHGATILRKWRDTRKNDPAETDLPDVAETDGADRRAKQKARFLTRYERTARRLVRERARMGKLTKSQERAGLKALSDTKKIESVEKRFEAIGVLVDRLNRLAFTKTSVHAMFAQVGGLCLTKRVPGVLRPKRSNAAFFDDVTGLGPIVQQAREDVENGRARQAYASLTKVAGYLKQFRD